MKILLIALKARVGDVMFKGWPRSPMKFFKIGLNGRARFIKCVTKIDDEETLDLFQCKVIPCPFCGGLELKTFKIKTKGCNWCRKVGNVIVLKNYKE